MEREVSLGIVDSYLNKFKENLDVDVAIVGGGPSGLVAGYYLASYGKKVALFERKLAPGGGMWGGAMMFNQIMVQKDAQYILDELGISYVSRNEHFMVDSVESTAALIYKATQAGVKVFNCISFEDVVIKEDQVAGIVINWAPVKREGMHVDPLIVTARSVLEGTGHDCEVAHTVARKNNVKLLTESGEVAGEKSLSIVEAERTTIENSKQIYPGLYVSGMAANAVAGNYRMGPVFGGMLLSGKKVADMMNKELS